MTTANARVDQKTADDWIGQVVGDRYEIVARKGPGTLGVVYDARHVVIDRRFVLEILDAERVDREAIRQRFEQAMRQRSRLRHPNVVELDGFGIDSLGSLYMATEHLDAPHLGEELGRRVPWSRVRGLALQIVAALDAAHRRSVMHGALQPHSCLVVPDGGRAELIKVADFATYELAIELRVAADAKGATTQLAGDTRYLAPEQAETGKASVAADVHAVGAVLYHLLTGEPPCSGVNAFHALHQRNDRAVRAPRAIAPTIPFEVEEVIMRALANEPGDRQPDARTLMTELESIPVTAVGEVEATPEEQTRRRVLAMPAPPHRPSRSMHDPPQPPRHPVIAASPVGLPSPHAFEDEMDAEGDATVMFAKPSPALPEVEATTMWNAQSLARLASPVDATEVLRGDVSRAPTSPPGAPVAPTTLLVSPAHRSPAPVASHEVLYPAATSVAPPHTAGAAQPAVSAPHPSASTARLERLVVVAMIVVAGIGVLIGLMLAGRPASGAEPSSATSTPYPTRLSHRFP